MSVISSSFGNISAQTGRRLPATLTGFALLLALTLGVLGCSRSTPPPATAAPGPLFFPPPPAKARVQYLGRIASSDDLPRARSRFADFVLGKEPLSLPLVKPINAILAGSKLYVCDTVLNSVLVYDLTGEPPRPLAGDNGMGKIKQPNNITVDENGRLYVADRKRAAVLIYGPDEQFVTALGRPGEAEPVDVAVSRDALYVCDIKDHQIEVWDREKGTLLRTIGEKGGAAGQFVLPSYVALDGEGNLYVTDTGNGRVQKFAPDGRLLQQIGQRGDALGQFAWPKGMDLDGHGRLYVADSRFANVQMFDAQGRLLLYFGGPGEGGGNLDLPAGLSVQPWPSGIAWLSERLAPGFDPEYLALVVNQGVSTQGVSLFAVARGGDGQP